MNRRTFLKKVGLVVVGSLGVIPAQEVWAQEVWSRTIFKGMFKGNDMPIVTNDDLAPVEIDGEKYFVVIMHPQQKYDLDVMIARDKYKHEQWLKRYDRWAQSQGRPPYQEIEGEVGTLNA